VLRSVTTHQLSLPLPQGREVRTALHTVAGAEIALVEIEDDNGAIGVGYAMTFRRTQTAAVRLMIHDLVQSLGRGARPPQSVAAIADPAGLHR